MLRNLLFITISLISGGFLFAQTPGGVPQTQLQLWVKANSTVAGEGTGEELTWGDGSGKTNEAFQDTDDHKPVRTEFINFNETFTFDGDDDHFAIRNLEYTSESTINNIYAFVVYKTDNSDGGTNGNWAFLDYDRSEAFNMYVRGDNGRLSFSFPDNSVDPSANTIIDNYAGTNSNNDLPHIGTFIYDKDVTEDTKMRLDGVEDYSATNLSTGIITDNEDRFGFIGDGSEATAVDGTKNNTYYNGDIAEIIYFQDLNLGGIDTAADIVLRNTAISKIESYLALKYGIEIPGNYVNSTNTTLWDKTASPTDTYSNNITALINDSTTGDLNQRVTRANGATEVILATSNDFTSANSDVGRTQWTDGEYLFIGDNGLTGFEEYDTNENILRTIWYIKESTSNTNTIHIAIPEDAFPANTILDIITSSDDVIDTGDNANRTNMILSSGYYSASLDLADGEYFSFITSDIKIAGISVTEFDLFIRADQAETSGFGLTLNDASFNGADAYQSSSTSTPTTTGLMNYNPTLTFDGANDYLNIRDKMYQAGNDITDMHMMAVYSTDFDSDDGNGSYNNNWSLLDFDRSEVYNAFIQPTGELAFSYEQRGGGIIDFKSTSVANDGLPHIAEFLFDRSGSNIASLKFDGNIEGSVTLTTNVTNPNVNDGVEVNLDRDIGIKTDRYGFIGDGSEADSEAGTRNGIYYDGQVSEIILADKKVFTTTETYKLETYLGLKYGVTLDESVQYLNSAGSTLWDNTDYWSGIAGIIKDDVNSDLDQKIAKSTSANDIILATNQDFTSSNLDVSRTTLTEGSSLLFGNNGLSESFTSYNGSDQFITSRKWLFKEVGTNTGDVFIAIPKTFFTDAATDVDILFSTNDSFEFADEGVSNTRENLEDDGTYYYIDKDIIDGNRIAFILTIPTVPSPGGISTGLKMWIKGDKNVVSSSGILTSIGDSSIEGNGVSQSSNINKPTNEDLFSYNPTIKFDGSNDDLAIENLNFTTAGEINKIYSWIVYKTDFSATPGVPDDSNGALLSFDRDQYFNMSVGGDGLLGFSYSTSTGGPFNNTASTATNNGAAHIAGFVFDTSLGTNETVIKLNGAEDFTGSLNNDNIGTSTATATRFGYIGDNSAASTFDGGSDGNYFDGEISEIVYYQDAALGSDDVKRIESYLAIKYGVTLDNTSGGTAGDYFTTASVISPEISATPIWDASANSDYHNNVAGIGRDDDSELNQKQGRSSGLNTMLSISIDDSVAINNESNGGAFQDNLDFLMWGSKITGGDAITLIDAETPTGDCLRSTKQVNRDWKVSNTGSVGAVTIQFDMSAIPDPNNYDLRIDEDGDGDYATGTVETITSGVLTENNLVFTGVTLLDGEVFTLASKTKTGTIIFGNDVWFGGSGTDGALSVSDTGESVQILNNVTLPTNALCYCMNIAAGSVVTIPDTQYLTLEDDLELDGDMYLEGDAELIQTGSGVNGNTGSGQVYKIIDDATASAYRYNYYSSPVNTSGTFTLAGNLKFNSTDPADDLSVNTDPSFTIQKTSFDTTISTRWVHTMNNTTSFLEVDESATMIPGVGFTMKGTGTSNEYNFIGSPNNGEINVPITTGNFLLTGNPYPSTINIDTFNANMLAGNITDGTAYVWDQPEGDAHATGNTDNIGGYATIADGVKVAAVTEEDATITGATVPTEFIKPGQGFVVYGGTTGGDVQFTNALRDGITFDGDRKFFKTNKLKSLRQIIRLGFEYEKENGKTFHRQIATSLAGNSLDREVGKDAFMFDYFANDAFWVIPNDEDRYIITSVPFASDDLELPIGVVIENEKEVTFKLDATENYRGSVYLYDNETKQITNIKENSYKVSLVNGEYRDRFSLVFNNQETLSNDFVDEKTKTLIRTDRDEIEVVLEKGNIKSIEIYTLTGELLLSYSESKTTNNTLIKNSTLNTTFAVVKVTTSIGVVTKKIFIE